MSFSSSHKARVLARSYHFSPVTANVAADWPTDMLDVTTINDGSKAFIPGQDTSTFTLSGWLDVDGAANAHFDQMADWKSDTAVNPITYGQTGLTVGSPLLLAGAWESEFATGSQVADKVTFSLNAQTSGPTDIGVSLADLAAITANTNGTVHDNSASTANGGVGHLHVTAYSGFTSVAFIIEHSTTNFSGVTLATFASVTGLTSERLVVAAGTTVNRYTRCVATVTGTGSITFSLGFARR